MHEGLHEWKTSPSWTHGAVWLPPQPLLSLLSLHIKQLLKRHIHEKKQSMLWASRQTPPPSPPPRDGQAQEAPEQTFWSSTLSPQASWSYLFLWLFYKRYHQTVTSTQTQPTATFCVACELRMGFLSSNGWARIQTRIICSDIWNSNLKIHK